MASTGKLKPMCRIMFAAVAAAAAMSPLRAQQVPGRQLFDFPLGTMAEAPALASTVGGGLWNPATIALHDGDRLLASVAALTSDIEQGVSMQLGTLAYAVRPGLTAGVSVASASVSELLRTDTDPQTIGDAVPYNSTIVSGLLAAARGFSSFGVAIRRRAGTVDRVTGHATSIDIGGVVDRPLGLPLRAGVSSFLVSPSRDQERASGLGAVEGYLPRTAGDARIGIAWQQDEGGGSERFVYAAGHAGLFDLRGGVAQQRAFGSSTTRVRLGVGIHYGHYLVGVAREDGTAGLGASYQFVLRTVIPKVSTQ
jgi:hypothetical protein